MKKEVNEILIYLTQRCNYSCKMCTQAGLPCIEEISADKWDKIFAEIKRDYPNAFLIFLGGEPLLHRDFDEILTSATKHGFSKHVVTNASLLKEHLPAIKDNYCGVTISLDGLGKTHDEIRNAKNAYNKAVEALKIMNDYNKTLSEDDYHFYYCINYVMLPENIDETEAFVKEIIKFEPKDITLNHTRYASIEKRNEMKSEMTKIFENPYNQHLMMRSNIDFSKEYAEKMNKIVSALKNAYPCVVKEFPDLSENERLAYYDDEKVYDLRPEWKCPSPYSIPTILPDGTVLSCLYNNLGNVLEKPLSELWQNEIARKTRDYLDKNKKFLACGRCTCYYKPAKV